MKANRLPVVERELAHWWILKTTLVFGAVIALIAIVVIAKGARPTPIAPRVRPAADRLCAEHGGLREYFYSTDERDYSAFCRDHTFRQPPDTKRRRITHAVIVR